MLIKRNELVTAMDAVKGAVASKTFQAILTHVVVDGQFVTAFDSEIGIKYKMAEDCGGKFNVRYDAIAGFLRALEHEDVELVSNGAALKLTCGKVNATFTQSSEDFPMPKVAPEAWHPCPSGFKEALERALLAASTNEAEKLFSAVMVKDGVVLSTNRSNAVRCTLPELKVSEPMLLSRKAVEEIMRLGQPERVAVVGPWSLWDYGNLKLLARLREGASEYPPVERMMDGLKLQANQTVPDGLLSSLNRLSMFGDTTRIQPSALGLELSTDGPLGQCIEWAPMAEGVGKKAVAIKVLASALPYADGMAWGGSTSPIYLNGKDSGFEFIAAPAIAP